MTNQSAKEECPIAARESLGILYETHHALGSKYGYTFGGAERGLRFRKWIGTGSSILDVGCRDGTLTRHYAAGNQVIGVDVDREALSRCNHELGITTHWADVSWGLPFDDSSFDAVIASEVMEHLQSPVEFVRQVNRVLREGGRFIGSVPNAFRLKNRLTFLFGREYETDPTHLHQFSPWTLASLLRPIFSHVEIVPIIGRFVSLNPKLMANTLLWHCEK